MTTRWAGETARERLQDAGEFTLHSVFDSAANLVRTTGGRGERLVHVSAHRIQNPLHIPFGVEVDASIWSAWSRSIQSQPTPTARWFWQPRSGRFTSRVSGVFDLVLGAGWQEAPMASSGPWSNIAVSTGRPAWPPPHLRDELRETCGLATTTDLARRTRSCVAGLLDGRCEETSWFLGRGPGLTPSGDDILIGILAALRLWKMPGDSPLAVGHLESKIIHEGHKLTTDVSRAYLRDACTGRFAGPTHRLLNALHTNDSSGITTAVDELRSTGHTSGDDTLIGWIATMDVLAEPSRLCIAPAATVTP